MRKSQNGFTLIELVIVIVILGILAAVAIPKFLDLSGDARQAATQGVAGALNSGSSINFSSDLAKGQVQGAALSGVTAIAGIADTSGGCTEAVATSLLQSGILFAAAGTASSYSISGSAPGNVGDVVTCSVINNDDKARTATFVLLGAK